MRVAGRFRSPTASSSRFFQTASAANVNRFLRVTLSVRLASLDEAPLVRSIMRQAFAEYAGALPVESGANAESLADVIAAMREGGAVLACDGDEAIASARFKPIAGGLYVGRVAVLPAHRRRGVASMVMRFLETVAVDLGHAAIHIEVRDSLPSNVGLYQSLGYELVSIDPHPRGPDRVRSMRKLCGNQGHD